MDLGRGGAEGAAAPPKAGVGEALRAVHPRGSCCRASAHFNDRPRTTDGGVAARPRTHFPVGRGKAEIRVFPQRRGGAEGAAAPPKAEARRQGQGQGEEKAHAACGMTHVIIPLTISSILYGFTYTTPLPPTSGMLDKLEARTGQPQTCASKIGSPNPSKSEGKVKCPYPEKGKSKLFLKKTLKKHAFCSLNIAF